MRRKSILYVSSELSPYTPESFISIIISEISKICYKLGDDIRVFMPKFGIINERRHQLHEVIRLSGINIIINDLYQPLVIKVASIPNSRLQVYFIDNEEYFKRKAVYNDVEGNFFHDNDERSLFFVKGILETVKKLHWKPDIIHIYGWLSYLLPLYVKVYYKDYPIFKDTKIIMSLYNNSFSETLDKNMINKINFDGINYKYLDYLHNPNYLNLTKQCIKFTDLVIKEENIVNNLELISFLNEYQHKIISYQSLEDIYSIYHKMF
jgi:starch synthase